jgi:glycosyltransferase involved in cell wall biosynthesis
MKIAWFTPFCRQSAIGQYSAVVLDHLRRSHEVTIYATGLNAGEPSWRPEWSPIPMPTGRGQSVALEAAQSADIAVYNLGDCLPFHEDIYTAHLTVPGVAVLHDVSTWNFQWARHALARRQGDWLHQIEFSHGPAGRAWGEMLLAGRASPEANQDGAMRWTMARSTIQGALGAVVHGRQALEALAPLAALPVAHIDFPSPVLPAPSERKPHVDGHMRLLSFGVLNWNKAPELTLQALAYSPLLRERCEYIIAGRFNPPELEKQFLQYIRDAGLPSCVRIAGRPDDNELHRLIAEADVLINLRYPHLGECSWSLAEGLWQGKPVVVWGHGYYDEFPETVVSKVTSLDSLIRTLEGLVSRPEERLAKGRRAHAYARERFSTEGYCRRLVPFLEECRSARPVVALADRVGKHMAALFGDAPEGLAEKLASEIGVFAPTKATVARAGAA